MHVIRRVILVSLLLGVWACSGGDDASGSPSNAAGTGGVGGAPSAGTGHAGSGGTGPHAGAGGTGSVTVGQAGAGGSGGSGGSAGAAGSGGTGGAGGAGGASGAAGAIGTAGGAGGASGAAADCIDEGYGRPVLEESCSDDADCFAGVHIFDCCQSEVVLAFNGGARAAFDAYEASCRRQPPCPCPQHPLRAEDGSPLDSTASAVAVCSAGSCLARARDAEDCSGAMQCIDVANGGACIEAPGPLGAGICRGAAGTCFGCDCASPETPIATPDGERPIASLRVGDLVYSLDGDAIRAVPIARVSRIAVFHHRVVQVRLQNGRTLAISAGHPTADGRSFATLDAGEELGGVPIVEAAFVDYPYAFTHDILPASSTGTYFAAGVPIGSTLF